MISPEDALSLINKWNQESSKLRCMYVRPGLQLMFVGTIDRISPGEAFGIRSLDKESSLILFFNNLTFVEYGDHRMAPDNPDMQALAVQYEGFLVMVTSEGNPITLGEIRISPVPRIGAVERMSCVVIKSKDNHQEHSSDIKGNQVAREIPNSRREAATRIQSLGARG